MGDKKQILLVEDYQPMAGAIESILEMSGYVVSTAADGIEALEIMELVTPDLIVADILMPEMDGYAFHRAVKERPEWRDIPFIFLTSMAEREDVQRGRDVGVHSYITKPFEPEELLAATRAELEGGRSKT
ncbi:MAG: response regulator [Anaerolineae bacterium]|jgi:CheY-like chemotaxis protein